MSEWGGKASRIVLAAARPFWLLAALAVVCAAVPIPAGVSDVPPDELDVKAAAVLNFIRLTRWTDIPGEVNRAEIPVCVLGNSEFGEAVRRTVTGKTVGSRTISFRIDPDPDPAHCRVLIVDAMRYSVARQVLNAVRDAPVMTIGNGPGLVQLGGMFDLIVQDRRVQFDVGLEALRRSHLEVSARLLQLSRNSRRGAGGAF